MARGRGFGMPRGARAGLGASSNYRLSSLQDDEKRLELLLKIKSSTEDYIALQKQIYKDKKRISLLQKDINKLEAKGGTISPKEQKILDLLRKQKAELEQIVDLQAQTAEEAGTYVRRLASAETLLKSSGTALKNIKQFIIGNSIELMKMLKPIKETELSMGLIGDRALSFNNNIVRAVRNNSILGANTKELSHLQTLYSKELGRSVILTVDNLKSMQELSDATGLGVEGASKLVANMDLFNVSVGKTNALVQDIMDTSTAMGVNSSVAIGKMTEALKLAQTYQFKGGTKALREMAIEAARLKLDMEGMVGFADKVFRPEGAVEAAARLQTMGGAFARLADPFSLMYKSRNDMAGFMEDISKAASEFITINQEGELELTAYQRDRMSEISEITGQGMEKLTEMARVRKRMDMIREQGGGLFSEKELAFLENAAVFENGQIKISLDGETAKDINRIDRSILRSLVEYEKNTQKSMEMRLRDSKTFDESLTNALNGIRAAFLPAMKIVNDSFVPALDRLVKGLQNSKIFNGLIRVTESLANFLSRTPETFILGALGLKAAITGISWFMHGMALAKGFNMVANVGGTSRQTASALPMTGMKKALGGNVLGGKFAAGTMGSFGASLGLGVLGTGLHVARNMKEDPDDGWGKTLGVLGSTAQFAGMGAMLGPWGALAGAGVGLGVGLYNELSKPKDSYDDFIISQGKINKINEKDDVIGFKPGGPIDKVFSESPKNQQQNNSNMTVSFQPLKVEGTITINNSDGSKLNEFDIQRNPIFLRELSRLVNEELSKVIKSGKFNPNPVF